MRALVVRLGVLAIVTAVAVFGFVLMAPDPRGAEDVWARKHRRLTSGTTPRIVFVGGSNLAFGLDSQEFERRVQRYTVNMGYNAHVGIAFMLNDVVRLLERGDTVIASFEYPLYYRDPLHLPYGGSRPFDGVHGLGPDLIDVIRDHPASVWSLNSWPQVREVAIATPLAAQQILFRLIREGATWLLARPRSGKREEYNAWGDFVSHEGRPAGFRFQSTGAGPERPLNPDAIAQLQIQARRMREKGIGFYIVAQPTPDTYFASERENIARIIEALRRAVPEESVLFDPTASMHPENCFFDSVEHLTWPCRTTHTDWLIQAVTAALTRAPKAQ